MGLTSVAVMIASGFRVMIVNRWSRKYAVRSFVLLESCAEIPSSPAVQTATHCFMEKGSIESTVFLLVESTRRSKTCFKPGRGHLWN